MWKLCQAQGVPDTYLQVLRRLYTGQSGIVRGSNCVFDITRGVKQGWCFWALCCSILDWNMPCEIGNNLWNHTVYTLVLLTDSQISGTRTIFCYLRSRGKNWWRCWNYWLWNSTAWVCSWIPRKPNCSRLRICNIHYTSMVVVICWPCCGERRNTSILAVPSPDIWSVARLVELQHRIQIGWMTFHQIQMYSHKQTHCFEIAFATVWCRCLSHNPIWFGYPAFDKIWLSHRGQTTTENASIDCWLDTTWRWRLVRYHVPDE